MPITEQISNKELRMRQRLFEITPYLIFPGYAAREGRDDTITRSMAEGHVTSALENITLHARWQVIDDSA